MLVARLNVGVMVIQLELPKLWQILLDGMNPAPTALLEKISAPITQQGSLSGEQADIVDTTITC